MKEEMTLDQTEQRQPHTRLLWIVAAVLLAVAAVVVVLVLVLPGSVVPGEAQTSDWVISSPEEQGVDGSKLEAVIAYIDRHDIDVDSIIVVRHGRIIFEEYGTGYSRGQQHKLYSVTKSVTSMLVGIAIAQGAIKGLDAPVAQLLPDYHSTNPDSQRDQITLEHLLTMSDGIDWREHDFEYGDQRNTVHLMGASADAVQFILDRPMARAPGEAWAYNSGASILLGAILEEATGRNLLAFAREVLFDPIGIGPVYWEQTSGGHYQTGGGLHMTPRDMARLGYLMLHKGNWNGKQVVPADWVARSTRTHYQAYQPYGYGYQWWILPDELGYRADGLYQQHIYVLPGADMVVAVTANIRGASLHRVDGLVNAFVLPACVDLPTPAPRATYDAYGLTFDYPARFFLEQAPIPGQDTLSDASGVVQLTSTWEPLEIVSVLWSKVEGDEDEDARSFLEAYLAAIEEQGMTVSPGELEEGQKARHTMVVQFSNLGMEGGMLPAVSVVWICETSGRAFAVTYLTTEEMTSEELLVVLERYLEGLDCH